jgi:hypothetical protein
MKKQRLTKSIRKFIRFEKARIRREVLDSKKQEELIQQLYKKFDKGVSDKKEISTPKKKITAKVIKKTKIVKAAKATKTKKSISKDK